ncbi:hypothetical protein OK074_6380 [Actinobacteria bacterium OK074]|nr:hypothetical protein OK074_6380 [Actinobacteria bacterium OK074]
MNLIMNQVVNRGPVKFPGQLARAVTGKVVATVFAPVPLDRGRALGMSERLAAFTTLTSSLEYLSQRKELEKGGFNDWEVSKGVLGDPNPLLRLLIDTVSRPNVTTALHLSRTAVSAALLLPGDSRLRGAGNLYLGASAIALYPRHRYGGDGTDQVSILTQTAVGAARLTSSPEAKDALLWYIALQSNLAYLTSGWVKLFSPAWRGGTALSGVMRTRTYGHNGLYRWTQDHPGPARLLAAGVLALECLFPVAYLRGGRLTRPVLASAAAFHLANGYFMGLGRFVTAFTALHPAVAYTSAPRTHPAVAGRDDRAPRAAFTLLAGAAAGAACTAVQRRLRTLEGWHSSRILTTRNGNRLQYEEYSAGDGERPVVVFVAGMGSASEQFAWLSEGLSARSRNGVLVYARAGYAGSRRRARARYRLSESVDDLVDLVNGAVAPHREVVLVGHSLGAEIARRAAVRLGGRLGGIVYLDPSHPDQFNRSAQQAESAAEMTTAVRQFGSFLRFGTGVLLTRPRWTEQLPAAYRDRAYIQYGDARLWRAALREWTATLADFRSFSGGLDPVDTAPGLVISAQRTVDRDPEQLLMHRELADAHRGARGEGEHVVIEGASHDGLLVNSHLAHQVGDLVMAFLDRLHHGHDDRPDAHGHAHAHVGTPDAVSKERA